MRCKNCGSENLGTSNVCSVCGNPIFSSGAEEENATRLLQSGARDPVNFQEGEIFAERYRIVAEIGRGGMGRVFRAVDLDLDIEIAIKVIRPEFLEDERMVRRFKNEILLAREVSHENVVRIHDFSEWQGIKFITMQYIDGMTLRSRIDQSGPFPPEEIENLAIQICQGLEAARRKDIAHRDLKPQNILIDRQGQVYLVDFGLAKGMRQSGTSVSGVIMGTPEYISPEQWKGLRGDFRSDIYSLGVILYEMSTARPLFQADTDIGYLHKHLSECPAFDSGDRKRVPEYLRRVIVRCLAKNPDMRYQSAAEVEADIRARRSPVMPLNDKMRRWARKAYLPFLALLVLGVLSWTALRQSTRSQDADEGRRSLIILPFANNTGEERYAFWSRGLADLLATDLGQSRHFRVAGDTQLQTFFARYPDWTPRQALDREQLSLLRRESGADFAMIGELTQAGDRFRVSARFLSLRSGEYREVVHSDGLGEESLFSMVDSLSDKTKLAFNLSRELILQEVDQDIRRISTSSLDALKAYAAGKEYLHLGRCQDAVREFERAVESDAGFAMAYAAAATAMNRTDDPRRHRFFELALAIPGRFSERELRMTEGKYQTTVKGDYGKALESFRKILIDHPDDLDALEATASLYRSMENWAESNRIYREMEALSPHRMTIGVSLFHNELDQGNFRLARDILDHYQNEFRSARRYHLLRHHLFFLQGLFDDAEVELNLSREENGNMPHYYGMLGNLMVLRDRLDEAETLYRKAWDGMVNPRHRHRIVGSLTNLSLHRGRTGEALAWIRSLEKEAAAARNDDLRRDLACDRLEICSLHPSKKVRQEAFDELSGLLTGERGRQSLQRRFEMLYALGRLQGQRRDWQGLEQTIIEMDGMLEALGKPLARYPMHLRSLEAFEKGDFRGAENHCLKAQSLFPNPRQPAGISDFCLTLARIKTAAGEEDEAMALYEAAIARQLGRLENAAVYVMAHGELARLQAKRGLVAAAGATAAKVLGWWGGGDADPQLVAEMRGLARSD